MLKMRCDREEILSRYLDDDLNGKEKLEFESHLSVCKICRVSLIEIRESEKAVREVVQTAFPTGGLAERILLRIRQEMPNYYPLPKEEVGFSIPLWKYALPVLGAAFLIFLLIFSAATPRKTEKLHTSIRSQLVFRDNQIGTIRALALSRETLIDGKKVLLGESVPVKLGQTQEYKGNLVVYLDGKGANRFFLKGSGKISATSNKITWVEGTGELEFKLSKPLNFQVQQVLFTIHGTKIRISGKIGKPFRMTLDEGKVSFVSAYGVPKFVDEGATVEIYENKVDLVVLVFGKRNTTPSSKNAPKPLSEPKNPDSEEVYPLPLIKQNKETREDLPVSSESSINFR